MVSFEYSVPTCDDTLRTAAENNFKRMLTNLDTNWKRADNTGAFCGNQDCNNAITLQVHSLINLLKK